MDSIWHRLSWPQVVALGLIVAGGVTVLVAVPGSALAAVPWEAIAGAAVSILGVVLGASSGPLVRRPSPMPRMPKDGSASVEVAAWVVAWGLALLAAAHVWGPR